MPYSFFHYLGLFSLDLNIFFSNVTNDNVSKEMTEDKLILELLGHKRRHLQHHRSHWCQMNEEYANIKSSNKSQWLLHPELGVLFIAMCQTLGTHKGTECEGKEFIILVHQRSTVAEGALSQRSMEPAWLSTRETRLNVTPEEPRTVIRNQQGKEDPSKNRSGNNLENMGNSMFHLPGQKLSGQGAETLGRGRAWFCESPSSVFLIGNSLLSNTIRPSALHLNDLAQVWVMIVRKISTFS